MTTREPLTLAKTAMALQWAIYRFMPESEGMKIPLAGNMALQLGLTLSSKYYCLSRPSSLSRACCKSTKGAANMSARTIYSSCISRCRPKFKVASPDASNN